MARAERAGAGRVTPAPTTSAAMPATWGAAIEVPMNHRYPLPAPQGRMVFCNTPSGLPSPFWSTRIFPPGAAMSISLPQLE